MKDTKRLSTMESSGEEQGGRRQREGRTDRVGGWGVRERELKDRVLKLG